MISPLKIYDNSSNNKYHHKNNSLKVEKIKSQNDSFVKNQKISFGAQIPGTTVYSPMQILAYAKLCYYLPEDLMANNIKNGLRNARREAVVWKNEEQKNTSQRVSDAIWTLGMSEVRIAFNKAKVEAQLNDCIASVKYAINELKRIEAKEKIARKEQEMDVLQDKIEYEKLKDKVKETELLPKLVDLIHKRQEGASVEIPNCVMLVNRDKQTNDEMVEWIANITNARFLSLEYNDPIDEILEDCEKNYQKTNEWNIVYIDGFEKLLNPSKSSPSVIESVKDLLSAAASEYHTTILFTTGDPSQLDSVAIESHRVKRIDTVYQGIQLKTPEEYAKERLKNPGKYAKDFPLCAVNDLLLLAHAKITKYLSVLSTNEVFCDAIDIIRNNINDPEIDVEKILNDAKPGLWFLRDRRFSDPQYMKEKAGKDDLYWA